MFTDYELQKISEAEVLYPRFDIEKTHIIIDNLTEQKFGKLKVLYRTDNIDNFSAWVCLCECGKILRVKGSNLRSGRSKSCGCTRLEKNKTRRENRYDLQSQQYGIGYDNSDQIFLFDKEDYELIKQYHWHIDKKQYAVSSIRKNGKKVIVKMHKLIQDKYMQDGMVDHKNGNRSDNRKENLRIANSKTNAMNRAIGSNNTTGVKGVYETKNGTYIAHIKSNKKDIYLGTFLTIDEAAQARWKSEKECYGEYMRDISDVYNGTNSRYLEKC